MDLLFAEKVRTNKAAFLKKVVEISEKLKIDPNWLMAVMNFESGLNPQARNTAYLVGGFPATGLIQFTQSTAKSLGTSVQELYNMSNVQQLDYVYKYYKGTAGKLTNFADVYLKTFFPAAIGKPDDFVIHTSNISARAVAKSNPVFDLNKDGVLTIAEVKKGLLNKIPANLRHYVEGDIKKKPSLV